LGPAGLELRLGKKAKGFFQKRGQIERKGGISISFLIGISIEFQIGDGDFGKS